MSTVDWAGRTFGELTPAEQRTVAREAMDRLGAELNASAAQITAVLDQADDNGDGRECGRCGDRVAYLSTGNLCDGCVAEGTPPTVEVGSGVRMRCDCGCDTFRLAGVQVVAVCTACGDRTPLGVGAFTIRS
jgi:hypothetical protein